MQTCQVSVGMHFNVLYSSQVLVHHLHVYNKYSLYRFCEIVLKDDEDCHDDPFADLNGVQVDRAWKLGHCRGSIICSIFSIFIVEVV